MGNLDRQTEPGLALLADAAAWRLLSLLFQRPTSGWRTQLESLAHEVGDPALSEAVGLASRADEGGYLALLGPGGAVSPRETGHQPLQDPGRLLADLSGFYRAFLYDPISEDPPDHIAIEVGFAAFLRFKETYAKQGDRNGDAEVTRDALNRFLEEHLSPFAESLHAQINISDGPLHLVLAANLLRRKIQRLESLVEIRR